MAEKVDNIGISTRVRLARNLAGMPFPRLLDSEARYRVLKRVADAYEAGIGSGLGEYRVIDMAKISKNRAKIFAEMRLISPEFAEGAFGSGLILTNDNSVSIMINEEDHIRIQVILEGVQLERAYELAGRIDDALNRELVFAYDERLGYLTECPTNLGTGMRASVMLHLPAMRSFGSINGFIESLPRLGFTVRGAYGEASKAVGALFQISNQVTLGITEEAATQNLRAIAGQIIEREAAERKELLKSPAEVDRIWRSLGILKTARLMSGEEALELASNLRLGIDAGIFENEGIDIARVSEVIAASGAAALAESSGRELTQQERDSARADAVRAIFNE